MERSLRSDGEKMVYPEGGWGFPSGGEHHPLSAAVTRFDALCVLSAI